MSPVTGWTPRQLHHLNRVGRLDRRHPGRFCWAELAIVAVYGPKAAGLHPLHHAAASVAACRADSLTDMQYCYCGAWHRGRYVGEGEGVADHGPPP